MQRTALWRAVAPALVLPLLASAALVGVALASAATVIRVSADDLGTVNYNGGANGWDTTTPSAGFDSTTKPLFTGEPTDGGRWTLDNEGKVPGRTAVTDAGVVLTVNGVPSTGDYATSQKVRYSYFLGSGGYPELDSQESGGALTVPTFFAQTFSYTGSHAESLTDATTGVPSLELRLQNPVTDQRVSLHSNGFNTVDNVPSPVLGATTSTVVGSAPDHYWTINSAAEGYSQQGFVSVAALTSTFAAWDVVSFGFNVGRGAEGTATISSLSALGSTFDFAPAIAPSITGVPTVGQALGIDAGDFRADQALSYQWFSGDTAVAGATGPTYTPVTSDIGAKLRVTVTGTRPNSTVVRSSSRTAPVEAPAAAAVITTPTTTVTTTSTPAGIPAKLKTIAVRPQPKIAGTVQVGKRLTAKAGSWSAGVKLKYQWFRGSSKITGATKSTYTLVKKDAAKRIVVKVTGTATGYAPITRASVSTKPVAAKTKK